MTYTTQVPQRTDDEDIAAPVLKLRTQRASDPWQKLTNKVIKYLLAEAQGTSDGLVQCAGCGRRLELAFMELDHMQPRSENGDNWITNRILLCSPCNARKSDKLTMTGIQNANKKSGWLVNQTRASDAFNSARNLGMEIRDQWNEADIQQKITKAYKE